MEIPTTSTGQRIYTIYKATNTINGKSYIGFDSAWPQRIYDHRRMVLDPVNIKNQSRLYNAMRKYGFDAFTWEIIYQSLDSEYCLNTMETYFIKEFQTFHRDGNGYNMTLGGEGQCGRICSEETKELMRQRKIGFKNPKLRKTYEITSPDGVVYTVSGLNEFCRTHGLSAGSMCMVANGDREHYKQYRCKLIS